MNYDEFAQWQQAGQLAPSTIKVRFEVLSQFQRRIGVDPETARWQDIVAYLSHPDWKPATRRTHYSCLRAYYNFLTMTGQRLDNPMHRVRAPRSVRGVPRPIAPADVARLLAAANRRRTRAMLILAVTAGLRVHEIAKIRGEHFRDGYLHVIGKGGVGALLPVHPMLRAEATHWPDGYWFPSYSMSGEPITPKQVGRALGDLMRRCGIPGTAHSLRHYFGTEILTAAGGNLRTTQELMRHASPTTTARYTQVRDVDKTAAVMLLPLAG